MQSRVDLLDFKLSPFCARVKVSLYEKGVKFHSIPEDISHGPSELLKKHNPINQKTPVLLHNGWPILESTIIVAYIDKTWRDPPLLPSAPYEESQASFWARFIDEKVFDAGNQIWMSQGDQQKQATKNFIKILQQLEKTLGDNTFFAGDAFGFVDVLLIPLTSWFPTYESIGRFTVKDHVPKLSAWIERTKQRKSVAKALPKPEEVYEFVDRIRTSRELNKYMHAI